ncbi:ABC transporter-like protein [Leptolyngbya boryana NIES-2135]|jgi:ATP-binding cassette subfamily F protein uup|uniref:ABC transporter-like protein n=1 Tax=Leptolyngbya boryana NIES-2135 TaxID=1973484 RepID=A0A1Z4JPX2_LEPBY|nr:MULTISPECIES: ABC-F family ATP-binding cassette domain-containing protein [Leptolyngbya]BAY58769.1 ABC transporter-like protein [Leptolyngbya boryana NIES-2135]MBD2370232.1 ABC-F family ATP-binding cassette domain-containing protein [Leptolyngbya sp. FACHB-161]MBD2376578.1 ABC-F family ATP-binding cassette domain-containing protein [Leptolyngbya sp. FACHB-238]MBD2400850.1 ABC-F family ATP-binding cassette domain-containing protein [Leptolyngbya sp. FACHB-239]MBD2407394.1 ABC-F family ATP-bi
MPVLALRSVKKDFGIKEIVRDANFTLEAGEKVGLIGTNGSGKSTLLKMVAGMESIDSGQLTTSSGSRMIYLPQQPDLDPERTVLEQVFADSGEQMALVKEYEHLSEQLAHGNQDAVMARLSQVTQKMDAINAWELETKAKIILSKLGIQDLEAKIEKLSGGYRKRVALATALLAEPDVLLMDEPTNHLDALSIEWLQSYLSRYRGALLLVTHDRYFLDQVTNRIIELDRGDLFSYSGNYSYYLEKKAAQEASEASSQRKHQGVLRRELEWLKRGAKARSTKQKARIDRVHEMQETEFKQAQTKVQISTAGRRIGKKVVELEKVTKGFGDRTLIKEFTYNFNPEDRVGIIGGNGAGKSTLLNLITGRLEPDSGTIETGSTIHFGYFDQHSDDLLVNENQRVIEYLKDVAELVKTADGEIITASQMLERFLFSPNQQYAPINKLSGGERRRLFLLRVLMSAPNVLILDEPTNDLDVQTLAVLEEYLEDFNGCVIVVSHDRYFLDRTVDKIFALESGGTVREYPGNYSVYLDFKKDEEVPIEKPQVEKKSEPKPASNKPRKLSFKEKRELEALEAQIPQMEEEKSTIEQKLYHNPPAGFSEVQKLSERLAELDEQIETATIRWMELSEIEA